MWGETILNVYIVDDDQNLCDCLRELISWEELGCHKPVVCYNGLEALDQLQKCKPDFVISDLKMPVMDGKELCIRIREQYPDVDIIFLSAYEDFKSMQTALQYGVKDYILKPISSESIEQIERIVRKIVASKGQKAWWDRSFDAEMSSKIVQMLDVRDVEFFDDFFRDLHLHKNDSFEQVKHFCIYLLHIIIEYIRTNHYLKEFTLLGANDEKGLKKLLSLPDAEACVNYVQNHYNEVLGLLPNKSEKTVLIDQIHELVTQHYGNPDFGVAWIAQKVHLSPAYLSRIYASQSESSLIEYIVDYRIKKAAELLRTTFLPINQVSEQVGYQNVNYFAKLFRNQKGKSPSEYRKEYHSGMRKE